MEIPLYLNGKTYEGHTVEAWQQVWDRICRMAYEGKDVCEKIVTKPGLTYIDGKIISNSTESYHNRIYRNVEPINYYFLTLENVWKQYSQLYHPSDPKVIPEFKELVVPYCLYNCLGVQSWFRHSFPNCKVYFWDE